MDEIKKEKNSYNGQDLPDTFSKVRRNSMHGRAPRGRNVG